MPRNLPGALLFYPLGLAAAGGGAILVARVFLDMAEPDARMMHAFAGAFLLLVGWTVLRGARTALRPLTDSDDGKFSIELAQSPACPGGKLEGRLVLGKTPAEGREQFRVELSCNRVYTIGDGSKEYKQRMYGDYRDGPAIEEPRGWTIPFSFALPGDAPASGLAAGGGVMQWRLGVSPRQALVTTGSWFDLQVVVGRDERNDRLPR